MRVLPIVVALLEFSGIVGFISLSKLGIGAPFTYLPFMVAVGLAGLLFSRSATDLNRVEVGFDMVVAALVLSVMFQQLRLVFPGVGKDVEFFSTQEVIGILLFFGVTVAANGVSFAAVWSIRHCFRK